MLKNKISNDLNYNLFDNVKSLFIGYIVLNFWGIFICSIMQFMFPKSVLKFVYGILPAVAILLIFGFVTHFSDGDPTIIVIYFLISSIIWGIDLRRDLQRPVS
jgi:hypothetical protein